MLNDNMMNLSAGCTSPARPRSWLLALMLSVAVGAAGLASVAQAADKATVSSKEMGLKLQDAKKAVDAHKYADAIVKLKEAEGMPKKNAQDQHIINQLGAVAYTGAKQYPDAIKSYEAWLADGQASEAEQKSIVKGLATLNYTVGNYDKAIEYGQRAKQGGYADDSFYQQVVVQSYIQKKDFKTVQKLEEEALTAQTKAGAQPKEHNLQVLLDACAKQGDKECQTKTFERLVSYYPQGNYWENLLYGLAKGDMPDAAKLQLFRLMLEVNVLKHQEDYTEMAAIAMDQGSPGEAQQILEKGFAAKVFPDQRTQDKNKRLLDKAKHDATELQAQLPARAKEAEGAATGDGYVKLGYAYLGFNDTDKAIDALNKGLAKGGLPNNGAEARLLLGVAQFKAGKRDDAAKTFRQVKGDVTLERISNLWALRAKQPEGKKG